MKLSLRNHNVHLKSFSPADEYTYFLLIKIKKMISLAFSGNKKETRNIKMILYNYITQHSVSDSLSLKADVQIHLFIKTT